jgi:hypothetical protein
VASRSRPQPLFWLFGDPRLAGLLLLVVPLILLVWVAPAAVWVHVSSHRPAATVVACGLGAALLVAVLLGGPFALRFSMARPELEAIAQRVLLTRTEEAPVRTQWLQLDAARPEDGAVYFYLGSWIDDYGVVYDPERSTSWSRHESLAPRWYQWMD